MKKSAVLLLALNLSLTPYALAMPNPETPSIAKKHLSSNYLDLSKFVRKGYSVTVRDPITGMISYDHDGYFIKKGKFYYSESEKGRLQGYRIAKTITASQCTLVDIEIPDDVMQASATSLIKLQLNLDANANIPAYSFDKNTPQTYNYQISHRIVGTHGEEINLSSYYVKKAENEWAVHLLDNNNELAVGLIKFTFPGQLESASGLDHILIPSEEKSASQYFSIDYTNSTGYAVESNVFDIRTDGFPKGYAVEDAVDAVGNIYMLYSNGEQIPFGKIAMQEFQPKKINKDSLGRKQY